MRRLLSWLMALCLLAGCGARAPEDKPEPGEAKETAEDALRSPVYTDWSHLTPYAPTEPVYTRFEPYSGSELLQARADYGPLLPYVGAYPNTGSYMGPLPLLGLVTTRGELVTDPVYADVQLLTGERGQGLYLLLFRGRLLGVSENEWGRTPYGDFTCTVAAPDGSWVREFPGGDSLFLMSDTELALACTDGSVTVLLPNGETEASFPREALEPYLGEDYQWTWEGGPSLDVRDGRLCVWQYNDEDPDGDHIACYLDPDTGAVSETPPEASRPAAPLPDWPREEPPAGYDRAEVLTDPFTGKTYRCAGRYGEPGWDLLDAEGSLLLEDLRQPYLILGLTAMDSFWVWGDRVSCGEDGFFCYYDPEGELVFRYPVETNSD